MNFITVPSFVLISYFVCEIYKWYTSDENNAKTGAFVPILAGLTGLVLGILAYIVAPAVLETDNIFTAMAIGISSGLAAVGVNQIIKKDTLD